MADNNLKFLLPMTGFLDTEIALAIKLTFKNKGKNIGSKYWFTARTYSSKL